MTEKKAILINAQIERLIAIRKHKDERIARLIAFNKAKKLKAKTPSEKLSRYLKYMAISGETEADTYMRMKDKGYVVLNRLLKEYKKSIEVIPTQEILETQAQ